MYQQIYECDGASWSLWLHVPYDIQYRFTRVWFQICRSVSCIFVWEHRSDGCILDRVDTLFCKADVLETDDTGGDSAMPVLVERNNVTSMAFDSVCCYFWNRTYLRYEQEPGLELSESVEKNSV